MDLLEHRRALLQPENHVLLHERKLDVARQLLELRQLRIRLRNQAFLVLLAAERQLGLVYITLGQALFCDGLFAVGQDGNAFLILAQLVALDLHVQDRLVLGRDLVGAACVPHGGAPCTLR